MSQAFTEQRVNCPRCRYRFPVAAPDVDGWAVDVQCPTCDSWTCFTFADTIDPPKPDPAELEAEAQRVGEMLWRPINEHRSHPAIVWFDRVGGGVFEDDYSHHCWPIRHWVYRFTRQTSGAYIWQENDVWFVRGWHPLLDHCLPPEPHEVSSFVEALDRLAAT